MNHQALLQQPYHLSTRQIEELRSDFFRVDLGLGTVSAREPAARTALEEPVASVHAAIQAPPVANVDETSWREGNRKGWLWVGVTPVATMFLLAKKPLHGFPPLQPLTHFQKGYHRPPKRLPVNVQSDTRRR